MNESLIRALRLSLGDDGDVETNVELGRRTTYRVGGYGAVFVTVESSRALAALSSWLPDGVSVAVLGNGSNVLVADEGFSGVAVRLGGTFEASAVQGTLITCGGGADLPRVARQSVEAGLTGFEWAVGVPGTVGGAVAMNAGGHGSTTAASLVEATVMDLRTGNTTTRPNSAFAFSYRHSNLLSHEVVVSATFQLDNGDVDEGRTALREIVAWRRAHQPGGQNCGSVFVNPEGASAGQLIDACGLRGYRLGSAEVSPKHANFIQADPDGRAADVIELICEVADVVNAQQHYALKTELRVLCDHPANLPALFGSVTP